MRTLDGARANSGFFGGTGFSIRTTGSLSSCFPPPTRKVEASNPFFSVPAGLESGVFSSGRTGKVKLAYFSIVERRRSAFIIAGVIVRSFSASPQPPGSLSRCCSTSFVRTVGLRGVGEVGSPGDFGAIGDTGEGAVTLLNACATSITVAREPVLGIRPCRTGLGVERSLSCRAATVKGGVSGGEGGEIVISSFARPGNACLVAFGTTLECPKDARVGDGVASDGLPIGFTPITG